MTKQEKEYQKIISQADLWVTEKNNKYNVPIWAYKTANQAGQKLAKHFKVDKNIILLSTILMDVELGRALKQNKINNHIKMSFYTSPHSSDTDLLI